MPGWDQYMRIAIDLARKGEGFARPNPLVGAVLVRDNQVVSRGWHRQYGGEHAEVDCLSGVPAEICRGSTIVVNLEPCSIFGNTPPCANLLIEREIGQVVAGMEDPNPQVSGRGFQRLMDAGIEVKQNVLAGECLRLNRFFHTRQTKNRPWVTLKWACSLDSRISRINGSASSVSCPDSTREVHRLRAEHPGIMIGIGTARIDNPSLNIRFVDGVNPHRYVIDPRAELDPQSVMAGSARLQALSIFCTEDAPGDNISRLEELGIVIHRLPVHESSIVIKDVLETVVSDGVDGLLVEGGADLHSRFLRAGLVDEVISITSPDIFGSGQSLFSKPMKMSLQLLSTRIVGRDTWQRFKPCYREDS